MKNRTALYNYFRTNNIPKQEDFHELIDSSLNQAEDGIRRAVNGPIELEARGAGELLNLYGGFNENTLLWKISHKPVRNGEPSTAGLNIADGQASRLFIRTGDGSVGIGTDAPAARLQVVSADNGAATTILDAQAQDLRQGVGLWWGGIRKTGTNADSDLALDAKGRGHVLLNANGGTGNVGIGTSAPVSRFSFGSSTTNANAAAGRLAIYESTNGHNFYGLGLVQNPSGNYGMGLWGGSGAALPYDGNTGALPQLYLDQNTGNAGLGTVAPLSRLSISQVKAISAEPGQNLGELSFVGFNRPNSSASIQALSKGYDDTGHLVFKTSPNGNGAVERLRITADGRVGVGTGTDEPATTLDVRTQDGTAAITVGTKGGGGGAVYLGNANHGVKRGFPNLNDNNHVGLYTTSGNVYLSGNGTSTTQFVLTNSGRVGIGTADPGFPLHVTSKVNAGYNSFGYLNSSGSNVFGTNTNNADIGIKSEYAIVAQQFWAVSDARLKTVIGQSDHAADLVLLRRLRITDYTMRERVQFGDQAFKKIIAQELEEVLPQAVRQHTGFLPDIYATASRMQRQGEALLIGLPAGLPQAATAGQRLKLIGPAGEVLATLAEAAEAGSQQLLVTGAGSLANTPEEVFVFGLEHADVRTVDYEAVAMLNVSATQALARQVEELHQQNAALNEQNRAQGTRLDEMQAALHLLQQQVAQLLSQPRNIPQPV